MPVDCQMCCSLFLSLSFSLLMMVLKKDSLLTAGKWERPFSNWRGKNVNFHEALFSKKRERFSANIKMQLKFCAEVVIFETFLLMVHGFWTEVNAI